MGLRKLVFFMAWLCVSVAQNHEWGKADGSWSDSSKWSGDLGFPPNTDAEVLIKDASASYSVILSTTTPLIKTLFLGDDAGGTTQRLVIKSGGVLRVRLEVFVKRTGSIVIEEGGVLDIQEGTFTNFGLLKIEGGTVRGTGGMAILNPPGFALVDAATFDSLIIQVARDSKIEWNSGVIAVKSTQGLPVNVTIEEGAELAVRNTASVIREDFPLLHHGSLHIFGVFSVDLLPGGDVCVEVEFNAHVGSEISIVSERATVLLTGGGVLSTTMQFADDGALEFATGCSRPAGAHVFPFAIFGGEITTASPTHTGTVTVVDGAVVQTEGGTIEGMAFTLTNGTLSGAGDLTINGDVTWHSGRIAGDGNLVITKSVRQTNDVDVVRTIEGRNVEVTGSTLEIANALVFVGGGRLVISNDTRVDMAHGTVLRNQGGDAELVNDGQITFVGAVVLDVLVENDGLIRSVLGDSKLTRGASIAGNVSAFPGASLTFCRGVFEFQAPSRVYGDGNVYFADASTASFDRGQSYEMEHLDLSGGSSVSLNHPLTNTFSTVLINASSLAMGNLGDTSSTAVVAQTLSIVGDGASLLMAPRVSLAVGDMAMGPGNVTVGLPRSDTLAVTSALHLTSGRMFSDGGPGIMVVTSNASAFSIANEDGVVLDGAGLVIEGTYSTLTNPDIPLQEVMLTLDNGSQLSVGDGGEMNVNSPTRILQGTGSDGAFSVHGVLNARSNLSSSALVIADGSVGIGNSSTVNMTGGGSFSGDTSVAEGSTLVLGSAEYIFSPPSSLSGGGRLEVGRDAVVQTDGTLSVEHVSVYANGVLTSHAPEVGVLKMADDGAVTITADDTSGRVDVDVLYLEDTAHLGGSGGIRVLEEFALLGGSLGDADDSAGYVEVPRQSSARIDTAGLPSVHNREILIAAPLEISSGGVLSMEASSMVLSGGNMELLSGGVTTIELLSASTIRNEAEINIHPGTVVSLTGDGVLEQLGHLNVGNSASRAELEVDVTTNLCGQLVVGQAAIATFSRGLYVTCGAVLVTSPASTLSLPSGHHEVSYPGRVLGPGLISVGDTATLTMSAVPGATALPDSATILPRDGATDVSVVAAPTVVFAAVPEEKLLAASVSLVRADGFVVPGTVLSNHNRVSFIPSAPLAPLTSHTLLIGRSLQGKDGTPLGPLLSSFVTAMPPSSGMLLYPPAGSQNIPVDVQVSVTPPDDLEIFVWKAGGTASIAGNLSVINNTAVFIPLVDLSSSTTYDIVVVRDGLAIAQSTFHTRHAGSMYPSGDVPVSPLVVPTVRYSTALNNNDAEASFSLRDESGNEVAGTFMWTTSTSGERVLRFLPHVPLRGATEYTINFATNATTFVTANVPTKDAVVVSPLAVISTTGINNVSEIIDGYTSVPTTSLRRSSGVTSLIPLSVLEMGTHYHVPIGSSYFNFSTPFAQNGNLEAFSTGVPPAATMSFDYGSPPVGIPVVLLVDIDSAVPLSAKFYRSAGRGITVIPHMPLVPNHAYVISWWSDGPDSLQSQIAFKTAFESHQSPAIFPLNGALDILSATPVVVTFPAEVVPADAEGAFSFHASTTTTSVPGKFLWRESNTVMTFVPDAPLPPARYVVDIGPEVGHPLHASFTVRAHARVSPAFLQEDVHPFNVVTLAFEDPAPAHVGLPVLVANGTTLTTTAVWREGGRIVNVFAVDYPAESTTVHVTVPGDSSYDSEFVTAYILTLGHDGIVSDPSNRAQHVPPEISPVIEFSEEAVGVKVHLHDNTGAVVAGSLMRITPRRYTFVPRGRLKMFTTYTMKASSARQSALHSFTTGTSLVMQVYPAPSAVVPVVAPIIVPLDGSNNVTITGPEGAVSCEEYERGSTRLLVPRATLQPGTVYHVESNGSTPTSWSFKTAVLLSEGPIIITSKDEIRHGEPGEVDWRDGIVIDFLSSVDRSTHGIASVTANGVNVSGVEHWRSNNRHLAFIPDDFLSPRSVLEIQLFGPAVVSDGTYRLSVTGQNFEVHPTPNDTAVPLLSDITVTFLTAVPLALRAEKEKQLSVVDDDGKAVFGDYIWRAHGQMLTLVPPVLPPSTTLHVTTADHAFGFTTANLDVFPLSGASCDPHTLPSVEFPVPISDTVGALTVTSGGTHVAGSTVARAGGRVMTFVPEEPWEEGQQYLVAVNADIRTLAGDAMLSNTYEWTFIVEKDEGTTHAVIPLASRTAPRVVPSDGSEDVSLAVAASVLPNEDSLVANTLSVYPAARPSLLADGEVRRTSAVYFVPSAPLLPLTRYNVELNGDVISSFVTEAAVEGLLYQFPAESVVEGHLNVEGGQLKLRNGMVFGRVEVAANATLAVTERVEFGPASTLHGDGAVVSSGNAIVNGNWSLHAVAVSNGGEIKFAADGEVRQVEVDGGKLALQALMITQRLDLIRGEIEGTEKCAVSVQESLEISHDSFFVNSCVLRIVEGAHGTLAQPGSVVVNASVLSVQGVLRFLGTTTVRGDKIESTIASLGGGTLRCEDCRLIVDGNVGMRNDGRLDLSGADAVLSLEDGASFNQGTSGTLLLGGSSINASSMPLQLAGAVVGDGVVHGDTHMSHGELRPTTLARIVNGTSYPEKAMGLLTFHGLLRLGLQAVYAHDVSADIADMVVVNGQLLIDRAHVRLRFVDNFEPAQDEELLLLNFTTRSGEISPLPGDNDKLRIPYEVKYTPNEILAKFAGHCPNECSGNGVCDLRTGECRCHAGFGRSDCSTNWLAYLLSIVMGGLGLMSGTAFGSYLVAARPALPDPL